MIKYLAIVAVAALLMSVIGVDIVVAQPDTSQLPPAPEPMGMSSLFKIPLEICYRLIYSLGAIPLYIIRGFGDVWADWGLPPVSLILASFSYLAPDIFKDAIIVLLFFSIIEVVCLPIYPCVWIPTAIGTVLFAIADFISKLNAMTAKESGRTAGWLSG